MKEYSFFYSDSKIQGIKEKIVFAKNSIEAQKGFEEFLSRLRAIGRIVKQEKNKK